MVCHELTTWQAVTGSSGGTCGIVGQRQEVVSGQVPTRHAMSPVTRTVSIRRDAASREAGSAPAYPTVETPTKLRSKLRRGAGVSLARRGPDLSTRIRLLQRTIRSRVERPNALLEVLRSVSASLEPVTLAELIVERAATWAPAPCWAVVSADSSGQLSVLAHRGMSEDMEPATFAVASFVMHQSVDFTSANLRIDTRVTDLSAGTVLAFPLISRGVPIGALVGLDRAA